MQTRMRSQAPQNPSLPTQAVRAPDLASALEQVRREFGHDALIVETREIDAREAGALAPTKAVEIRVAVTPSAGSPGTLPTSTAGEEAPSSAPTISAGPLAQQLSRLESLSREVDAVAELAGVPEDMWQYPLAAPLRRAGAAESTIVDLATSFVRGGEGNSTLAARRHLASVLRTTTARSWEDVAGEHWFLGRAGSGKTTMLLNIAALLRRSQRSVAIVATAPTHTGERQRVEAACSALEIPLAVVNHGDELSRARLGLGGADVVLVDTPCFLSRPGIEQPGGDAYRHLVVPLGEDPLLLRDVLQRLPGGRPDTLAISQADLCPRSGRMLDLVRESGCPVAFFQSLLDGTFQVELATTESLLQRLAAVESAGPPPAPAPRAAEARG